MVEVQTLSTKEFDKQRVIQIITDAFMYSSHVVHEIMYKQLVYFLVKQEKENITVDDLYAAFNAEQIDAASPMYKHYEMSKSVLGNGETNKINNDFVSEFVKALEGLTALGGPRFVGIKDDAAFLLQSSLQQQAPLYASADELIEAVKAYVVAVNSTLSGKENKNKRRARSEEIKRAIAESIKQGNFSLDDILTIARAMPKIAAFRPFVWEGWEKGYKSLGYENIYSLWSGQGMVVVQKDGFFSLYDSKTSVPLFTDAEQFESNKIGSYKLVYNQIALRKGKEWHLYDDSIHQGTILDEEHRNTEF